MREKEKEVKDDEGMGYNTRKEFLSRGKSSLSASGNFLPAERKSREEDARARMDSFAEKEFGKCLPDVYRTFI